MAPRASISWLLFVKIVFGIGDVVLGVVRLTWADGFDVFGWHTTPNLTSGNLRVLKYQGTSGYDGPFADLTVVK